MKKRGRNFRREKNEGRSGLRVACAVVLIVYAVVMVFVSFVGDERCTAERRKLGECQKRLASLDERLARETALWNEMKQPRNLTEELRRHALAMQYPEADQVVRMNARGEPAKGQYSVAKAQARAREFEAASVVAMNAPGPRRNGVSAGAAKRNFRSGKVRRR